jgi:hypothetical protein
MWLMILNSLCGVSTWMPHPWASQLSNDGGFTGATIESLVTERGSNAATIGVAKPYRPVACVADRVQGYWERTCSKPRACSVAAFGGRLIVLHFLRNMFAHIKHESESR